MTDSIRVVDADLLTIGKITLDHDTYAITVERDGETYEVSALDLFEVVK